ncbi:MAG: hypothetical protein ABII10_01640 [Candidatus Paceibacterota bacterium]
MSTLISSLTGKPVTETIDKLEPAFKGLPHLPKGLTDFLVSISPWAAGIGGIFGILAGLQLLSSWLGWGMNWYFRLAGLSPVYFLLVGALQILGGAVLLLAFNPLKARQMTGWILLFVSLAINLAQNLVGLIFSYTAGGSLIGSLLGLLISLYVLFELKNSYKPAKKTSKKS